MENKRNGVQSVIFAAFALLLFTSFCVVSATDNSSVSSVIFVDSTGSGCSILDLNQTIMKVWLVPAILQTRVFWGSDEEQVEIWGNRSLNCSFSHSQIDVIVETDSETDFQIWANFSEKPICFVNVSTVREEHIGSE